MIIWDEEKNIKLKLQRGIGFEEISDIIINKNYLEIIDHPVIENQDIFVVKINDYIHAVPFVIDKEGNIVLKTVFPSRKLHKIYGDK